MKEPALKTHSDSEFSANNRLYCAFSRQMELLNTSLVVLKELFCRKLLLKSDILREVQITEQNKEQENIDVKNNKRGSLFLKIRFEGNNLGK